MFHSFFLFGLNCLRGKKKSLTFHIVLLRHSSHCTESFHICVILILSFNIRSFYVYLRGCVVYRNKRIVQFVPSGHDNAMIRVVILFLRQSLKEGYPFTSHLHVFLRAPTCTSNCCFYCLLSGLSGHPLPLITSICPSLHPSLHPSIHPSYFTFWVFSGNSEKVSKK